MKSGGKSRSSAQSLPTRTRRSRPGRVGASAVFSHRFRTLCQVPVKRARLVLDAVVGCYEQVMPPALRNSPCSTIPGSSVQLARKCRCTCDWAKVTVQDEVSLIGSEWIAAARPAKAHAGAEALEEERCEPQPNGTTSTATGPRVPSRGDGLLASTTMTSRRLAWATIFS